jgi:hypothetical protein
MERVLIHAMFDVPEREDVLAVVIDEAVVRGEHAPLLMTDGDDLRKLLHSHGLTRYSTAHAENADGHARRLEDEVPVAANE